MPKLVAAIVVVVLVLITIDLRAQTPDAFSPGTAAVSGSAGGGAAGEAAIAGTAELLETAKARIEGGLFQEGLPLLQKAVKIGRAHV